MNCVDDELDAVRSWGVFGSALQISAAERKRERRSKDRSARQEKPKMRKRTRREKKKDMMMKKRKKKALRKMIKTRRKRWTKRKGQNKAQAGLRFAESQRSASQKATAK